MRRYLRDFDTSRLPSLETDVLIVGAGIAGLWTALHLPKKTTCTVICKYGYEECNSWLAQGGVAAVFDDDDTFESHIKDTLTAGAGLCNEEVVDILVREAPENMSELISFGVPFDRDDEGNLHMGREGGHSCRRILHSGGDATGRAITFALREKTKSHSNIQICEDTVLTEIFTDEHGVCGALVKDINGYRYVKTANVVMASGGIGHIYRYTTNPRGANGDGIAAAVRAGAKVDRMEMIQFHPTTLITKKKTERQFLISEAVRGEGAILRNGAGEAFMESVHPLKDLAPRDVVTIGILNELKRTGEPHAYLDVSSMTRAFFLQRFPNIYVKCETSGIRLTTEEIPVHPSQHYFMGGIAVDKNGMTNVDGLWAVGECACNGVHGANRLASNSMLECLVFGKRCAESIKSKKRKTAGLSQFRSSHMGKIPQEVDIAEWHEQLRKLMGVCAGAIRTEKGLLTAKEKIAEMLDTLGDCVLLNDEEADLYAMLFVSALVVDAALQRKESVGAHYLVSE